MNEENRTNRTNQIAKLVNGNVWIKKDNMRVYLTKGYIVIDNAGDCNIDNVGGHLFMDVKEKLNDNNIKTYRG